MPYAGATSPEGWLLCDGAAVSRTEYANLWALIGTTYGSGNGTTTFNAPDMRSRIPMGAGAGTGLTSRALAATGGAESVVIASGNLPTHTHSIAHDHANATSTGQSVGHTHSVDPPNTGSTTGSADHTHSVDPPNTNSGTVSSDHSHGGANHNHGSTQTVGHHEHRLYFVTDAGSGTARARVSAAGATLSNYGISEYIGDHNHGTGDSTIGTTGGISANHSHATDIGAFNSAGQSVGHTHNTDIAAFDSAGASVGHTHDVDLPNFTGDSGDGGFANTALATMNPFLSVNYIIKY
jgi:microcystin-dependent protein